MLHVAVALHGDHAQAIGRGIRSLRVLEQVRAAERPLEYGAALDPGRDRCPQAPLADERLQARDLFHRPRLSKVPLPLKDTPPEDDQERVQAARRILRPRRLVISAAVAACVCVVAAVALASGGSGSAPRGTVTTRPAAKSSEPPPLKPHPKVVQG